MDDCWGEIYLSYEKQVIWAKKAHEIQFDVHRKEEH